MRTWAAPLRDFGRLVLALQALAPALDGRDELREVDLERVEDLVGVVLGAEPDLPLAGAGILDDVLGRALGLLDNLLLARELRLALARLLDDPLGLALGLGEHLLTLLDDPARLLDLLGDRRAHLVEDVVDLLLVDTNLVRERDLLRVVHEVVELVDEDEDIHGKSACGSLTRELFLQAPRNSRGHVAADVAAERGHVLDPARTEERVLGAGDQVDGLDVGRLVAVQLRHLGLVEVVADRAQALDDGVGALLAGGTAPPPAGNFARGART